MRTVEFFKRSVSVLLCVLMLIPIFSGCAASNPPVTDPATEPVTEKLTDPATQPATEPATDPITDPVTDPVTEPVVVPPVLFTNPLTGLESENDLSGKRPVSLSIDNVKKAMPSIGISLADVIIELPFEGYETRLVAIYQDYENLPTVGNIRSARDYSVRFAADFDSILVHAGSDTDSPRSLALNAIRYGFAVSYLIKMDEIKYAADREDLWTDGVDTINGLNYYPSAMFRDIDRMYDLGLEHSTMINGQVICDSISYKSYRTTVKDGFSLPYCIGTKDSAPQGASATQIRVPYNPYMPDYGCEYQYDAATGLYKRFSFDHMTHVDGMNGEQIAFKNVIILEIPANVYEDDRKNRLNVEYVGEGVGYYCCEGNYERITWSRADANAGLVIKGADGELLDIVPGKVMINVYPSRLSEYIKIN